MLLKQSQQMETLFLTVSYTHLDVYKRQVQENVGEHTINFTFEFDGQLYNFSRSNVDYKHVFRCDEKYEPLPEDVYKRQ